MTAATVSVSRRRLISSGLFATLAATASFSGLFTAPALAHETPCPYCKMTVTQDTPAQDNEVALRYGRKRIEYKCVWCAVADVNRGTYKDSDVTVLAPTEKKSQPIEITRKAGKWAAPAGTVFLAVKASHQICQNTYRAFTSKAAFDAYVKKNQAIVKGAAPLTLDQMVASAK
ncbi:MAG: hypothetical protein V4671_19085 [Armatimonadota bacterium]